MEISTKMIKELQDTLQMMDNWVNSLGREIEDNNARHVTEMREVLEALQVMLNAAMNDITEECDVARSALDKYAHYLEEK